VRVPAASTGLERSDDVTVHLVKTTVIYAAQQPMAEAGIPAAGALALPLLALQRSSNGRWCSLHSASGSLGPPSFSPASSSGTPPLSSSSSSGLGSSLQLQLAEQLSPAMPVGIGWPLAVPLPAPSTYTGAQSGLRLLASKPASGSSASSSHSSSASSSAKQQPPSPSDKQGSVGLGLLLAQAHIAVTIH
jgi:hypothetical protein